ncbi:Uncharacterised protein [Klebsiella pneumoniae]|nr:Uncharacterised protein [Klebsiella pneumoniae]
MTSLLDVLKEADLRIGFSDHFKSVADRENLDRQAFSNVYCFAFTVWGPIRA